MREVISILTPTRKRPKDMRGLVESCVSNCDYVEDIEFVFYIDEDDTQSLKEAKKLSSIADVKYIVGERVVLSKMWNVCYDNARGDIFMHCGDDLRFRTKSWDTAVREKFDSIPDKIAFVFGDDGYWDKGFFGTHGFLHKKWVETVGYFVPPYFSSDYNDTWLNEVSNIINRHEYVDIYTEHLHYINGKHEKDQTHLDRLVRHEQDDVQSLYESMSAERLADAKKLMKVISDYKDFSSRISNWIDQYCEDSNIESLVVGVSGGVDSALTSTLCAKTGRKTFVVSLPIHQNSSQLDRANKHIEWLKSNYSNVESIEIDLSELFDVFSKSFKGASDLSLANSRSRLRMTSLYQVASERNGIVVGTGNKVEDFGVGFYTKYGDGGVDISPIADLTKSEVWKLAKKVGVIDEIVNAAPTDGLWGDDRTDEDQIGASYPELEWAMDFSGDPSTLEGRAKEVYYIYSQLNSANQHKMNPIPVWKK